jgi:hypothetical protein
MKAFFLLLFITILVKIGICQKPVSGYMISALGDTAKGYLVKKDIYIDEADFVFFDSTGQIANNKSQDWRGLGVYTKDGTHHFIKVGNDKIFGKNYFFIERVLLGKICVYKTYKDNTLNNFLYPPAGQLILNQKNYRYYLQKNNGEFIKFEFEFAAGRKTILKELFSDCEKVNKKVKGGMGEEKTFHLILEYNYTCN